MGEFEIFEASSKNQKMARAHAEATRVLRPYIGCGKCKRGTSSEWSILASHARAVCALFSSRPATFCCSRNPLSPLQLLAGIHWMGA